MMEPHRFLRNCCVLTIALLAPSLAAAQAPPERATMAAVRMRDGEASAYDRTTFYMGVTCYDSDPDGLLRYQIRRDQFLPADDRFMWVIDPFLTAQSGYHFETNPSGLMGEGLLGPAGDNRNWDGGD